VIGPVVAPDGTVAVIAPPLTRKLAAAPLNATAVVFERFEPLIVTDVPATPLAGEKLAMDGGGPIVTVKLVALVAVPAGVVTLMGPLDAPEGTLAAICVAEMTVKRAPTPANFTAVAPLKSVPVMVTVVPF
jgi:hypothetical protein